MPNKITLVTVKDPLHRWNRDIKPVEYCGQTLLELRKQYFPDNIPVVVSINGKIIEEDKLGLVHPVAGDYILFAPDMQGGDDGKSIIGTILMIVMVVAAPYVGGWLAGAAWGTTASTLGGFIGAAAFAAVGGLLINTFVMPTPDIPGINNDGFEKSQTYSWQPQTIQEQGIAIPRFYGLNKLYGNIISSFTATNYTDAGEENQMNVLLGMGLGPYKRFFNFKINDQLKDDDSMPFNVIERRGEIEQTSIDEFSNIKIEHVPSRKITEKTSYTYTTPNDNFDSLEIDLKFPSGLWYANNSGGLDTLRAHVRVKIRKQGDSTWTTISNSTITTLTSDSGYWSLGKFTRGDTTETGYAWDVWWEGLKGDSDPNSHHEGEREYSDITGDSKWRWIGSPLTMSDVNVDYIIVTGSQTGSITQSFNVDVNPTNKGYYEIYVEYIKVEYSYTDADYHQYWTEIDYTSSRFGFDMYLYIVREVTGDPFRYPRLASLGVTAIANDKISGSFKFSCMSECAYINIYTGTQWNNIMSDNPAWVTWDILTQPVINDSAIGKSNINTTAGDGDIVRYDGIDPSKLDLTKFKEWADYCDDQIKTTALSGTVSSSSDSNGIKIIGNNTSFTSEVTVGDYIGNTNIGIQKVTQIDDNNTLYVAYAFPSYLSGESINNIEKRCTFNGGFDVSNMSLFEAAQKVAEVARAVIVLNGNMYTVAIDKPITVPAQMFNVANIKTDTFKETFLSMEDRASELEVDYINIANDFERERLNVFNVNMPSKTNKLTVQGFGIQKASEAWRYGMFKLYKNQYLQRVIEFDANVEAITTTLGDGCYVQHDVPQWSYGGRIVSATTNTVTLDKEVTIESGEIYTIMIVLSDDTRVEKTVTNGAGTYTTLNLSTPFDTIPQKYNNFLFGKQGEAKIFKVLDLSKSQDLDRTITCIEYNESIYNVDTDEPVIPTPDVSDLDTLPDVTNLLLDELIIRGEDGAINDVIDVYFSKPNNSMYASADIWYDKGAGWQYSGNTISDHYRLSNVEVNITYTIAVVTVNTAGQKADKNNAPSASIYTQGKLDPPSTVTNFTAAQNGQFINFNWDHIVDADRWGYELRKGTDWESASVIATVISQNQFTWQAELNGTYRFLIKSIDESGLYSTLATSVDITLTGIDEDINVILYQEEINNPTGTKTNFSSVSEIPALMIPFGVLDTDVPTRLDTDTEFTNYTGDSVTTAEYITDVIDTFKIGKTTIRITTDIDAYDLNATDQSYPDRVDTTYPSDTDTHITMPTTNHIYLSYSDYNVDWTAWSEYFGTVQESFRYVKVKFTTDINSTTGVFKLKSLYLSFDTPDVDFTIEDYVVSATGNDVDFSTLSPSQQFYSSFTVRATLLNDAVSKVPVINKNNGLLGFNIYLLDVSDTKVSGTVDIQVTGY